jgi:hypothetical protein
MLTVFSWALYLVGGVLMTVGGATMFTVTPDSHMANVYGFSILLGAGTGLVFQAGYTVGGVKTMLRTGSGHRRPDLPKSCNEKSHWRLTRPRILPRRYQEGCCRNTEHSFCVLKSNNETPSNHSYHRRDEPSIHHQHRSRSNHSHLRGVNEEGKAIPSSTTDNCRCRRSLKPVQSISEDQLDWYNSYFLSIHAGIGNRCVPTRCDHTPLTLGCTQF